MEIINQNQKNYKTIGKKRAKKPIRQTWPPQYDPRTECPFSCHPKTMLDVFTAALDLAFIEWKCKKDAEGIYRCIAYCSAKRGNHIFSLVRAHMSTDDKAEKEKILNAIQQAGEGE